MVRRNPSGERKPRAAKSGQIVTTILVLVLVYTWCSSSTAPSRALPIYARRYDVPCDTCHSVVPRLNDFGLAFQANHFEWPIGNPPAHRIGLNAVPISGLALYLNIHDITDHVTIGQFQSLELFASNGFVLSQGKPGGYFVDYYTGAGHGTWGALNNAFVSVPVAGRRGELAVTAGQLTPMMYQYDPVNSLTITPPTALGTPTDAFSFITPMPGARVDYFDGRSTGTADGNYVSVGVPYAGNLAFNRMSHWDAPIGDYLTAFHRFDKGSYGAFGYVHDSHNREGLLGTFQAAPKLALLAAASMGKAAVGRSQQVSLEADYLFDPYLAVVARFESTKSDGVPGEDYPVYAVVYYPGKQHVLRLVGETIQDNIARSNAFYALAQF